MNELLRKIATLTYVVESYGDLGAERELESVRAELRQRLRRLREKGVKQMRPVKRWTRHHSLRLIA